MLQLQYKYDIILSMGKISFAIILGSVIGALCAAAHITIMVSVIIYSALYIYAVVCLG